MGVSRELRLQRVGSSSYYCKSTKGVPVILESEMDQTLKRVNGELRMIGSRLDRIDQKLPKFDLKIKDLKEEDKVARYWTGVETDHEKTFLRTQRRLDNTHERRVEAEERRRGRPLWNHHHTRLNDGPDYLALRMEVPVWVQQKYKSSAVSTKNDPEMQTFLRSMRRTENDWMQGISKSATLFSPDSCRKTILDSINLAWMSDKYKDVESKYGSREV